MERSNGVVDVNGSIALVGDLMLRSRLATLRRSQDEGFDAAIKELKAASAVVANLEMPLSRRGSRMLKHSNLRSDPEIIEDVKSLGVDGVSLANNHMMDYGPDALFDTLDACDGAGMLRCGAGRTLDESLAPMWLDVAGRSVAVVSVSSTLPLGSEATEGTPGIAPIRVGFSLEIDTNLINEQPGTMPVVHSWARPEDQADVVSHIQRLKAEADLVVVAIHWGVPAYWLSPHQGLLAEYQQPLGRALIDAGADVVFGHHSHSSHGIEIYKKRPIVYSAGNFIFESPRDFMEPESFIFSVDAHAERTPRLIPLLVDDRGLPVRATGSGADQVISLLERLSEPFGTKFERDGDEAVLLM